MTSDFSVNMNEYLPLRDVVFNTLRQAILKGELKPGERLMEIALAERLGVSRTPIREAMRKLEQEGLVVMIPRRGAQVANITEKDLNDGYTRVEVNNTEMQALSYHGWCLQISNAVEGNTGVDILVDGGDLFSAQGYVIECNGDAEVSIKNASWAARPVF